ncbi:hypothetical protein COLO4_33144 [Corchorus olitorius]|uniref:Uncharacterized protein n=1 Tax=Corchorus olitorius TaxID=93759 RepID=A0A1R3GW75_9ROSI|nr:hypothetical protein COLO4_33144 [Corchorus olitorius]
MAIDDLTLQNSNLNEAYKQFSCQVPEKLQLILDLEID